MLVCSSHNDAQPTPSPPLHIVACAVLDMVTDRVATTCLLAVLCTRFPAYALPALVLIGLDIFR